MTDLKCNSCGSNQLHKIESEANTYVCLHCGNKQVVEENTTNNSYNVTNHIVNNVYGEVKVTGDISQDDDSNASLLQKVDALIKLNDHDRAYKMLIKLSNDNPEMYQVWWLLTKVSMNAYKGHLTKKTYYHFDYTSYEEFYEKAKVLANEEQVREMDEEYKTLLEEIKKAKSLVDEKATEASKNHLRDTLVVLSILIVILVLCFIFASLLK